MYKRFLFKNLKIVSSLSLGDFPLLSLAQGFRGLPGDGPKFEPSSPAIQYDDQRHDYQCATGPSAGDVQRLGRGVYNLKLT